MRRFISRAFAALLLASCIAAASAEEPLKVGMQTWTLRNLSFEEAVDFCAKHKIKYLQLIPNHVNPDEPRAELERKKAFMARKGVVPYTYGVAGTSLDKEENRKLFEFAKFFGMELIVVEPRDFKILDNLEELAKEYDMKVVIHNHGIKSLYGNPAVLRNLIKYRDKRIGVCMDTGWVASGRFDVPKTFKEYEGRVYDVHLKDKRVESTPEGDIARDTFIGEGDASLGEFLKVLEEANYEGVIAIETDKNLKDPTEHTVRALQFIRQHSHQH